MSESRAVVTDQAEQLGSAIARVEAVLPILGRDWAYPTVLHQIYHQDIPLLLAYVRERLIAETEKSESATC